MQHPYFKTHAQEQRESARERQELEAIRYLQERATRREPKRVLHS
jgi:hypothetical protein